MANSIDTTPASVAELTAPVDARIKYLDGVIKELTKERETLTAWKAGLPNGNGSSASASSSSGTTRTRRSTTSRSRSGGTRSRSTRSRSTTSAPAAASTESADAATGAETAAAETATPTATPKAATSRRRSKPRGGTRRTPQSSSTERAGRMLELLKEKKWTRAELAEALGVSPARVQQLAATLPKGAVETTADPDNPRRKLWSAAETAAAAA